MRASLLLANLFVCASLIQFRVAEATTDKTRTWALIVGIQRYELLGHLQYPRDDARVMFETLTDAEFGFFDKERTILLLDDVERSSQNFPSKSNIIKSLEWISDQARDGDLVLFYFSGHGTSRGKINYIFPPEHDPLRFEETSISTLKIFDELDRTRAKRRIVMIDACRAGAKREASVKGFVKEGGVEPLGRFELYAAREGTLAYEAANLQHGVFTASLLEALAGKADTNSDSMVTLAEVKRYSERRVQEWSKRNRKSQSPRFGGDFQGELSDVVLAHSGAPLAQKHPPDLISVHSDSLDNASRPHAFVVALELGPAFGEESAVLATVLSVAFPRGLFYGIHLAVELGHLSWTVDNAYETLPGGDLGTIDEQNRLTYVKAVVRATHRLGTKLAAGLGVGGGFSLEDNGAEAQATYGVDAAASYLMGERMSLSLRFAWNRFRVEQTDVSFQVFGPADVDEKIVDVDAFMITIGFAIAVF